jgi:hypothetical protein
MAFPQDLIAWVKRQIALSLTGIHGRRAADVIGILQGSLFEVPV